MTGLKTDRCWKVKVVATGHNALPLKASGSENNGDIHEKSICITQNCSVNPLGQVVAGFQSCTHLIRVHARILGAILGVLPLEKLDTVLSVWGTAEVAIRSCLLIFRPM